MGNAPLMLGVSGLRGIVGESLTPEVAAKYAGTVGRWLREIEDAPDDARVAVAADGRAGYEAIYHAVIAGLLGSGCDVLALGVEMTPTVAWKSDSERLTGGVVVTASHNPAQWNGIKVLVRDADGRVTAAPTAARAAELVERFQRQQRAEPIEPRSSRSDADGSANAHAAWVAGFARRIGDPTGLHAVLDSVNASGSEGANSVCGSMGVRWTQLHGDGSGVFPHPPEPTRENLSAEGGLCDAVPALKADVGFAQDPDADRLAIIDENGQYIGEEYTLVLAALALLEARGNNDAPPPVIVANLSTSRMIDDLAAAYNARVVRTPVGEANVVERMMALRDAGENVILGGEGNGGVIWPDVVYVRDSLSAMALTLALMARTAQTVSQLVARIDSMANTPARGYAILKRKVDIPSKDAAQPAVDAVSRAFANALDTTVDTQDGVRVDWPDRRAWVHVRASNTEPIMRLIAEAGSPQDAQRILADVEKIIAGA